MSAGVVIVVTETDGENNVKFCNRRQVDVSLVGRLTDASPAELVFQ